MKLSLTIPENLNEIKLSTFIQLVNLFNNAEDDHELVVKIKAVSIALGISLEDTVKIPAFELNEIFEGIAQMMNQKPKLQPVINVNGKEYGFIPDMEELKTNEYLDLTIYYGTDILKTTAILYRPVKQKIKTLYSIEDYKGTKDCEIYNDFPASAYVSCMLFFYNLMNDLLKTFPQSLEKRITEKQKEVLEQNGVGRSQLISSLEEIASSMTTLPGSSQSTNF